MRKILTAIITVIAVIAAFSVFPACGGDTPDKAVETITVSFIQDGQETQIRQVEKGGTLKGLNIPVPVDNARYGYKIEWDVKVFKNLTEDLEVHAVEVAKTFVVMFDVDGGEEIANGTFTYDAPYELPTPIRDGYSFKGWKYAGTMMEQSGDRWTITYNVSFKAIWEQITD